MNRWREKKMEQEKRKLAERFYIKQKKAKSLMTNGSVVRRMSMKWISKELKIER